jgi:hypothetical protein
VRLVFLAEVTALDPQSDQLVTLRMCSRGHGHVRLPDYDHEFTPCIVTPPVQTRSFNENGIPGQIEIDYGAIGLAFHPDLRNMDWRRFDFDSYPAKLWYGEYDQPFSSFKAVPAGRVGSLAMADNPHEGTLAILGPDASLKKSILSASYAGTGGAEGSEDLKGTLKPFRIGLNESIDPLLIDNVNLVYQYHGYGPTGDVLAVYENALSLGEPKFTASTYDELTSYSAVDLPPGTWAKGPAVGMFRLGGEMAGKPSADVIGAKEVGSTPRSIGAVCSFVLRHHAGVPANMIDEVSAAKMDADFPHTWGNGIEAQTESEDEDDDKTTEFSVGEFVREACSHISGYVFCDAQGVWRFGRNTSTKPPLTVRQRGTSNPIVIEGSIGMPATSTRVYKVRVGGRRCFSVHSSNEVSSALKDAIENGGLDPAVLNPIRDTANAAVDNANSIRRLLPNLVLPLIQQKIEPVLALQLEYGSAQLKAADAMHKDSLIAVHVLGTRVDENGSKVAEDILQLTSAMDVKINGVTLEFRAGLLELKRTVANTGYATSETVLKLIAILDDEVAASFVEERRVLVEKDRALTESIRLMGVKLDTDIDGERVVRDGQISDLSTLLLTKDTAMGERVSEMGVRITTEVAGEKTEREAAISTVNETIITERGVRAQREDEISSRIDTVVGEERQAREAVISDVRLTQVSDNEARAVQINNVQSRLDNFNGEWGASVEQKIVTFANDLGQYGSSFGLKLQGYSGSTALIGGFGIVNNGSYVDTAFLTDAFRIFTAQGAKQVFYADGDGVIMDRAFIGTIEGDNLRVTNASIQNLTIAGDKFEPSAVTSVGSFETDFGGYHSSSYGMQIVGGNGNPTNVWVTTGNTASNVLITCTGVYERDGGDDDNLAVDIERYGGSSGTVFIRRKGGIQVMSGKRTYAYQWLDTTADLNTQYRYYFCHAAEGNDGSPYWFNTSMNAVCHKK